MAWTYAIGDVHGRFDLLAGAIDCAERHAGAAGGTLIVLGDMVDRGPNSSAVVAHLMAGPSRPGWRWIVLKGNHEAMMLGSCGGSLPMWTWVHAGGGATLHSYGYSVDAPIDARQRPLADHLAWIAERPTLHADRFRIFVHAGVDPDAPLWAQDERTLLWKLYPAGDNGGHGDRHIVHGHRPDAAGPYLRARRTGIDTHAWFSGRLAVCVFDDALPGGPVDVLWAETRATA